MPDTTDPILDASAVLAVIFGEAGADRVAGHLPGARISSVNAAEVMTKLVDLGMPEDTVDAIIEGLQLTVVPFEVAHARECARLRTLTRGAGLSLGDRACLAVARQFDAPAFTTDRAWLRLDGTALGVTVELLR
ncbi:type II toxin-antitoxin system VapC family toxin [Methylobacterium sp. Gmos1]